MPIFKKLHLVLDFCIFKPVRLCSIRNEWRFSMKSEDYSKNYGFLKQIISADDVVSDAFQ